MHFDKFCIIFTWIFRSSAPGVHQPSQGAFLQPGNIAAADAQLVGSLLLGSRTLPAQAVAQLQQRPFPHRQGIHQAAQAGGIGAALIQCINSRRWTMVGSFILAMIVLMLIIEFASTRIRGKLARGQ